MEQRDWILSRLIAEIVTGWANAEIVTGWANCTLLLHKLNYKPGAREAAARRRVSKYRRII